MTDVELATGGEIVVGGTTLRVGVDNQSSSAAVSHLSTFGELVGESTAMRELFSTLERVAPKGLSVLVQGETGTGKEEVARALHSKSTRSRQSFVVIDATALPQTLAESLLFGHEKGAFTGADQRRVGFFEAADGGTVFIDEIGELPVPSSRSSCVCSSGRRSSGSAGSPPSRSTSASSLRRTATCATRSTLDVSARTSYYRLAQSACPCHHCATRRGHPLLCQKLLMSLPGERAGRF